MAKSKRKERKINVGSFLRITVKKDGKGVTHVSPNFSSKGKDIMIKGGEAYAMFDESSGLWVTDPDDIIDLIDDKLYKYAVEHYNESNGKFVSDEGKVVIDYLHLYSTKALSTFKSWTKDVPPNHNFKPLDSKLTMFEETPAMKDYRSKKLLYKIEAGPTPCYDLFMSTCYAPEERNKLEWAVGSILCGDSVKLQKFIAVYGNPGTGKSTFFNIISKLFEGYWSTIDVDALVSRNNQFGTEALKDNPLVCIQHDADLSRIEKNDVLNSIVSHEVILINEKQKRKYPLKLNAMIFIGTNEIINISDTKQGINRRMIDVYPTGNTLPVDKYDEVKAGFKFELGAIAAKCIDVYKSDPGKYTKYKPSSMIKKVNVYVNFVSDRYFDLCDSTNDPISARDLYRMFTEYMQESGYQHIPNIARFKEIMLDFYEEFKERDRIGGRQIRSVFSGFKKDCLDDTMSCVTNPEVKDERRATEKFQLSDHTAEANQNPLNLYLADMPAQKSNAHGVPSKPWAECKTKLAAIDCTKEHYVKCPKQLICVDFDIKDENGDKSLELNLKAAQKWPLTYAEVSKSGKGLHLHYIYDGDVSKLSRIFEENVEVKVYEGNAALRRKLTLSNMVPIAHISSGLPLREEKPMVKEEVLKNEKALRTVILKNLNKEYHSATKPSIDFIFKVLDDAYKSGMHYDVSDLENRITAFANNSTHNADYCLKMVSKMIFQSDDVSEYVEAAKDTKVFYDVEVFSNVFICCWKEEGEEKKVNKMIQPRPAEIEVLFKYKLIGFNNRKYDNHMLWARSMGYTNQGLFDLSQRLINGDSKTQLAASFSEAYNLSYTDVYDFAKKKQSLKKWEIELGIHHLENSYPWDKPLPPEKWEEVADYCCNDVIATEAVFNHCHDDFIVREVLAKLSGLTVNHTNRQHITKFIFGNDKNPELVYTDLSTLFPGYKFNKFGIDPSEYNGYDPNDKKTWHTDGKSVYMGEDPSEGGRVEYTPGIYYDVGLLDIASMHPSSIIALNLFGKYTKRFEEVVNVRLAIKHGDFDYARKAFDGALAEWLTDENAAGNLAEAFKLVINSVYGYTSANFENPFRDKRNVDNIVAKRGALFMILLKKTLEELGVKVVHVKTDSIKVPNITPEIVAFVQEFGRKYGYNFEHESTYEKMCIVNGSTYIAKAESGKHAGEWVAVAAQFQHPYVLKTLFTKEPLIFKDFCEVKEVKSSMVLDFNEDLPEGEHKYVYVGKVGSYIPVKEGFGGGVLLRDKGDKIYEKQLASWNERYGNDTSEETLKRHPKPSRYASVTGADGYRWKDSETMKDLSKEVWKKAIDMRYFNKLADDAIAAINEYGSFEEFINYSKTIDFPPNDENPY